MLYPLAQDLPGSLAIMTRPKVLQRDLATIQAAGITTVISLLEPQEAASLGLSQQARTCANLGLTFLSYPIRDMHLPDQAPFARFASDVAQHLRSGAHIALHCRASIGRSGMLACTVLGHFGYTAQAALAHVSTRRGTAVPDTAEQAAFITRLIDGRAET